MYKICKPSLGDVAIMRSLILPEVQSGIILDRSEDEMASAIRSYTIMKDSSDIIAFSALHIHSIKLGEVRSLIVKESHRRKGIATMLIEYLLEEASNLGLKRILTLTYKREVFEKIGFVEIAKEAIPDHKIWADCIKCTRFPICDEIALIKDL
ncbi:N-acetyltransferase [Helicobacter sp. MIT 14-3879]|uniref:N-acetyltransferase n=1 Tax=Helicobacter sp. MIT 14-3879 TaxID=2040649 RepID=UPI00267DB3AE|nr:N-acetyltransferase [Helicobacter sp. MIT 14-3879]